MQKAWTENNMVRDVAPGDPATLYHPDIAAHYTTDVPDGTLPGATRSGGQWVNPTYVPKVVTATPPTVSPLEFQLLFTSAERVAIKAARATDAVIEDFLAIVEDPRLTVVDLALQSTQDALAYLEQQGYITADRRTEILTGTLK